MTTATIELSEAEMTAIEEIARSAGKTREEVLHDAVNRMLEDAGVDTLDWRALLQAGEGIWEHRTDLPDFEQVRREMDRELW